MTMCDGCGFQESHLIPTAEQINQLRLILGSDVSSEQLSPEVAASFRGVVDEAPREIARYDSAIQRLEETLAHLRSDRESLQAYSNGCRNIFSIIRRFPTELLGEIFDLLNADNNIAAAAHRTKEMIAKTELLQASQVCSRWYGVIMGTRRLWSTIIVDTNWWPESGSSDLFRLLACSLERSGDHPLDMQIAVGVDHAMTDQILGLLSRHSHRWKMVYLRIHPLSFRYLSGAKGNLPLLENLTLDNRSVSWRVPFVNNIFDVAPRLTDVSMLGWPAIYPIVPWEQLVTFSCFNAESNHLSLEMLRLLPHQRCDLVVNGPSITAPFQLKPVESKISTLILQFAADPDPIHTKAVLGALLGCLALPSLTHLRFIRDDTPAPLWNHSPFMKLALRSSFGATLTTFEAYAVIEEQELLDCLTVLPVLQQLYLWDLEDHPGDSLHHVIITDNLIRQLTWRPNHANIVPRLDFMCLTTVLRFSDEALEDCINSRVDPCLANGINIQFRTDVFYMAGCERPLFPAEFVARVSRDISFNVAPDEKNWK
ncbi:hypothetical protein DFH06DRAFT_1445861 [Mycena polygramma]|nr:hypothetical protein DFH06DRAFT_1445861 [Mycena polygramma]